MIYQERYGLNANTVIALLGAGAFIAVAILLPDFPLGLAIVILLFFGGGGLLVLGSALSRKVALRVDQSGITLGGPPLRYRTGTRHVPWADIETVMLWRRYVGTTDIAWMGILRRADAPPLRPVPTTSRGHSMRAPEVTLGNVPDARLLDCAKSINGWKIDTAQFATVLQSFAPHVRLIDHR